MSKTDRPLIERLIVEANRLTRIAALATGSTTPAAVWRTLSILAAHGPFRIGDLARASRVAQPTMTKLVRSLVEDGLVHRLSDAADSRACLVAISSKGATALDDWRTQLGNAMAPMFSDLTPEEREIFEKAIALFESRTTTTNTTRKVA